MTGVSGPTLFDQDGRTSRPLTVWTGADSFRLGPSKSSRLLEPETSRSTAPHGVVKHDLADDRGAPRARDIQEVFRMNHLKTGALFLRINSKTKIKRAFEGSLSVLFSPQEIIAL